MNPIDIINKYYTEDSDIYNVLIDHSRLVADKALEIAGRHPELNIDKQFVEEAAMLHDIGVFMCDAKDIHCNGNEPYIKHGILGAEILRKEGFPRHALVCERHTGSGITKEQIMENNLPIPAIDMLPVTIEEKFICYADKFYSKSKPGKEKSIDKIRKSMEKYGNKALERFDKLNSLFK